MNAVDKTKSLKRVVIPVSLLVKNSENPNKMGDAAFNMLCDNIEKTGITDPILVRPISNGLFRVIGGHHRVDAAKCLDFEEVPCTVITDKDFDDEAERFQLVRMNVIKGKLDPVAFFDMYKKLSKKYTDEVIQESFGFTDAVEFKRLVSSTGKSLPKELEKEFFRAAKDIKTIDELASVLNELLSRGSDQLDYGYMVIDFGGQQNIWLRLLPGMKKDFLDLAALCRQHSKTMDQFMYQLLKNTLADGLPGVCLSEFLKQLPDAVIPEGVVIPTIDNIG